MECLHEDTADGLRIIRLAGRMDIDGNEKVALRFNTLTLAGGPAIIVDLSALEFLCSLGIATLISGAKTVNRRNGLFAFYGASPNVQSALERTNVTTLIPTCTTFEEARARVTAASGN